MSVAGSSTGDDSAPVAGVDTGDGLAWPMSVRFTETTTVDGALHARYAYQFTGSSWNDWATVLLRIEDADGIAKRLQIGYVQRFADGRVQDGWLRVDPKTLANRSIDEVNALIAAFPDSADAASVTVPPEGIQAPASLFNDHWSRDYTSGDPPGREPLLPTPLPADRVPGPPDAAAIAADAAGDPAAAGVTEGVPALVQRAERAASQAAKRLGVRSEALATVFHPAGVWGYPAATYAIVDRASLVPVHVRTAYSINGVHEEQMVATAYRSLTDKTVGEVLAHRPGQGGEEG